ncbi:hypothetical protein PJL18_04264 [Paenarthrobacter nicotinovorans]|nr:hypothetical protein [Paenarthrobacter nicotinovorans]
MYTCHSSATPSNTRMPRPVLSKAMAMSVMNSSLRRL